VVVRQFLHLPREKGETMENCGDCGKN
jgi:hypothetical protein